jgi:phage terminase large subunit GpA-like protein
LLDTHYPTETGAALKIVRFAIDSGYATPEVYDWTRKHGGSRVVVIKGDSRASAPVSHPSPIDVGPRGNRLRFGIKVWPVNTGMIKEELYRWLRLDRPTEESGLACPPGYCHFPKYGEEYFKQLTAEQLVTRVIKGYRKPEWQKTRDRNEALDVRLYARAAAAVHGMDRFSEEIWKALETRLEQLSIQSKDSAPADPQQPRQRRVRYRFGSDWLGGRGDNWFDRRGSYWD